MVPLGDHTSAILQCDAARAVLCEVLCEQRVHSDGKEPHSMLRVRHRQARRCVSMEWDSERGGSSFPLYGNPTGPRPLNSCALFFDYIKWNLLIMKEVKLVLL